MHKDENLASKLREAKTLLENQLAAIDLLLETLGDISIPNGTQKLVDPEVVAEAKKQYYAKRKKPKNVGMHKAFAEVAATLQSIIVKNPGAELSTKEIRKILCKTLARRISFSTARTALAYARRDGQIATNSTRRNPKTGGIVGGKGSKWIFMPKGAN